MIKFVTPLIACAALLTSCQSADTAESLNAQTQEAQTQPVTQQVQEVKQEAVQVEAVKAQPETAQYTEWQKHPEIDLEMCLQQLNIPFSASADGQTYKVDIKFDHDVATLCAY